MKPLFRIDITYNEETKKYGVFLFSLTDGKGVPMKGTSLRKMLATTCRLIREKNHEVKHFPMPEPSRIITPNGDGGPKLVVLARN